MVQGPLQSLSYPPLLLDFPARVPFMFSLTKQERLVLLVLAGVIFVGSFLQYVFKKYPHLKDSVHLIDSEALYEKVDLNRASVEELVRIPYIGEYTARNIVEYRRDHGRFYAVEDVKNVKGIKEKNYAKFFSFLTVSGHR